MEMAMMMEFVINKMEKLSLTKTIYWILSNVRTSAKLKHKSRRQQHDSFCFPGAPNWQEPASGCSCDFWQQLEWGTFGCEREKPAHTQTRAHHQPRRNMSGNCDTVTALPFSETQSEAHLHSELSSPSYNYIFHVRALGEPAAFTAADNPLQLKVDNNLNVYWLLQPSSW